MPESAGAFLKILGFLLLLSGWAIVLSAVVLLPSGIPRIAFMLSGIGVEVIGLVPVARSHPLLRAPSAPGERE